MSYPQQFFEETFERILIEQHCDELVTFAVYQNKRDVSPEFEMLVIVTPLVYQTGIIFTLFVQTLSAHNWQATVHLEGYADDSCSLMCYIVALTKKQP